MRTCAPIEATSIDRRRKGDTLTWMNCDDGGRRRNARRPCDQWRSLSFLTNTFAARSGFALCQHNAVGINPVDVTRVGDPPGLPLGTLDPDLLLWAELHGRV